MVWSTKNGRVMKIKFVSLSLVTMLFLFAFTAFAQVAGMPADLPDEEFLKMLLASIGGLSGASALGVAAIVVQLLVALLRTNMVGKLWQKIPGIWKIISIMSMSAVSSVVTMTSQGVSVGAALIHSSVLSALMVLGNEIYKHFTEKKAVK